VDRTLFFTADDDSHGRELWAMTLWPELYPIRYLPLIEGGSVDLVVESLAVTGSSVQVVIKNVGSARVVDEFWVDVYIDPDPPPTVVNQTWDQLGDQGLVWGVTSLALPLDPGETLTLTVGDGFYRPDFSLVSWPLPAGTPVWVQVDSVSLATTYGGVLESHEIQGEPYNNILGPVSSAAGNMEAPVALGESDPAPAGNLPPRP
jgi:hypothetical protein